MSSSGGKGDGRDIGDERGPGGEDRGRDVGRPGESEGGEDNVVRLPRDWLGPRDELVPFGPSADRDEGEQRQEEVGSAPADPVSPDDFWGERSAALQGALDEPDGTTVESAHAARVRERLRGPAIAALGATAVALVVLACLSLFGQSPSRGRPAARARVGTGQGRGLFGAWPALTPPTMHGSHIASRSNNARRGPRRQQGGHSSGAVPVSYSAQPASQLGANAGGRTAAAGARGGISSATKSSPSNAAPSPPSTPTFSHTTPSSPATSSSSGSHHQAAQTRKAPAFGPNGALGPGHSRDG